MSAGWLEELNNKLEVQQRSAAYGFWILSYESGKSSETSSWQSLDIAFQFILKYLFFPL